MLYSQAWAKSIQILVFTSPFLRHILIPSWMYLSSRFACLNLENITTFFHSGYLDYDVGHLCELT